MVASSFLSKYCTMFSLMTTKTLYLLHRKLHIIHPEMDLHACKIQASVTQWVTYPNFIAIIASGQISSHFQPCPSTWNCLRSSSTSASASVARPQAAIIAATAKAVCWHRQCFISCAANKLANCHDNTAKADDPKLKEFLSFCNHKFTHFSVQNMYFDH